MLQPRRCRACTFAAGPVGASRPPWPPPMCVCAVLCVCCPGLGLKKSGGEDRLGQRMGATNLKASQGGPLVDACFQIRKFGGQAGVMGAAPECRRGRAQGVLRFSGASAGRLLPTRGTEGSRSGEGG